jgi:hypothetical protein
MVPRLEPRKEASMPACATTWPNHPNHPDHLLQLPFIQLALKKFSNKCFLAEDNNLIVFLWICHFKPEFFLCL